MQLVHLVTQCGAASQCHCERKHGNYPNITIQEVSFASLQYWLLKSVFIFSYFLKRLLALRTSMHLYSIKQNTFEFVPANVIENEVSVVNVIITTVRSSFEAYVSLCIQEILLCFHTCTSFNWCLNGVISIWECVHETHLLLFTFSYFLCEMPPLAALSCNKPLSLQELSHLFLISQKIETGNHYYSHQWKEFCMTASERRPSNSNDPKNLLHWLPVIVGVSFTTRGTRSS